MIAFRPALIITAEAAGGLLAFATVANLTLMKLKPANPTFKSVASIIRSWWLMACVFIFALALGPYGLALLFYLLTIFALHEYMKVTLIGAVKRAIFPLLAAAVSAQYLALVFESTRLFYTLAPLLAIWILPVIVVFSGAIKNIAEVFAVTMALLLVGYYLSYLPAIMLLLPDTKIDPDRAITSVVLLVILTEGNDVLQFLSGKCFGRKKVFPLVSPNKTEAGFLGGILLTTLLAVALTRPLLGLDWAQAALLGFSLSLAGIMGDLIFSALKRYLGIKDFSMFIPGHGGILDRLDSLILTAPVFFHLLLSYREGFL